MGELPDVANLVDPPDHSPPGGRVWIETVTPETVGPEWPTTSTQYSVGAYPTTLSVT